MPSTFTWLDTSEHDRRRAMEVIDLFRRQATRDELGIGTDGGANVERHVLALPLSRDRAHLEALRRSLAVCRTVFGQPRQDDLMAYLLERVGRRRRPDHQPV